MSSSRTVKVVLVGEDKASGAFGKAGRSVDQLDGHLRKVSAGMGAVAAKLGVALGAAGAGAAAGILKVGIAYQNSLNTFQAVSRATTAQMEQVRRTAKALGADMSLPATSAADAALAMTELAKGGLKVDEAMRAAKGTLTLAAAAQIDGALAAQIQVNALNQFGLKGNQAAHVADVLANTANAASGEITDMANSLSYVGPVANAMGVSIDDTATAIGLLAKNGVLGEKAGTALRGMFASLASPSSKAAKALKQMGIDAYDAQGKFVGLRALTDQLAVARKRLTTEQFSAAAATAFDNAQLAALNVLAKEGAAGFDAMGVAVTRQGGAADVAAAKTKGLGGALQGLRSQLETIAINIDDRVSPAVEGAVRKIADALPGIAATVGGAFDQVVIDLKPLAARVKADAASIGKELLAGVRRGIDTGDWSALAKSIEKGITGSLNGLGRVMAKIGEVLGKVDWMKLGIAAGKQAPAFILGIALGFLNADWAALIVKLGQHWKEVVFAILAVGLAPAKVTGVLVKLLGKIPFIGRFVAWLAEAFIKISRKLVGYVGSLLGKLGSAFLRGMGFAGRIWVAALKAQADFFLFRLRYYATIWGEALLRALERMAEAAGRGVKFLFKQLVAGMTDAARGFGESMKSLLVDAGKALIGGFIRGIGAAFGAVKGKLGELTGKLPTWKGPPSTDATILFGAGQLVIQGFIAGLESKYAAVRASLATLTAGLPGLGLAGTDFAGARARANESPLTAALRERDAVKATIAGLKGIDAAAAHLADTTRRTASSSAAHVARLLAGTRAADDHARAQTRAAQAAAARAAAMPAQTRAAQAAKAAAQAHARALLEEARDADDAARKLRTSLTDARNASTKAAAASAKASGQAKVAANELSSAMQSLAEKQAALADAAYTVTLARGSAFLDTLKTQMQELADKAQSLRDAFSGSVTGGAGLTDLYAKVTGEQQKAAEDAAKARDDATRRLTDAQAAATDAQAAYDAATGNSGTSTDELAAASVKLAAAQQAVVDATAAVAKASDDVAAVQARTKLTVQTILDELKTRVLGAQAFAQDLGALTGMGLSDSLIKQIAAAGLDTGRAIAGALLDAGPGAIAGLNELTAQLDKVATSGVDQIAANLYGPAAQMVANLAEGIRSQLPELTAAVEEILALASKVDSSIRAIAAPSTLAPIAVAPPSPTPVGTPAGPGGGGPVNNGSLDPRYIAGIPEYLWTARQRDVADMKGIGGQQPISITVNGYNQSPAQLAAELAWQMK